MADSTGSKKSGSKLNPVSSDNGEQDAGQSGIAVVRPGDGEKGDEQIIIPDQIALLPVKDTVVFPGMMVPLRFSDEKARRCIDAVAVQDNKILGLVIQRTETENPSVDDLARIGTAAIVARFARFQAEAITMVLVQGVARIAIGEIDQTDPFFKARVTEMEDVGQGGPTLTALAKAAQAQFESYVALVPHLPDELNMIALRLVEEPGHLADFIASHLNVPVKEKQAILETLNVQERLERAAALLGRELQFLELGTKIQKEVQGQLSKTQREYYLREQVKAIQRELGEGDEREAEITELRQKIKAARMPEAVEEEALKELDRLSRIPPAAAEYTVSRSYIDWLVTLPWSVSTTDSIDINGAARILDEDHYDLKKVKERILEFLAVRKLKDDSKGPILCFVGPPGTGKTSVGRSIARSMGRKFVRLSLGGVRDEAEIRGHRRTYVGALPGRIIQSIRKAGTNNPVFMLDEVDKLGADFRGDPSSALLEVLDPEQNNSFSDHYLDVPFDLSRVLFITTANVLYSIPPPLRDRMEVLELPGYTEEEKLKIAEQYLVPRQVNENGLNAKNITFEPDALREIISRYTREAGVRNLEREIAHICRIVAKDVAAGKKPKVRMTAANVSTYLGPEQFYSEVAERTSEPGVATGLAVAPTGGEILFVESTRMRGNKGLTLTGQLGDVMKESATAAVSYVRSRAAQLGIDENVLQESDLHIHVPAGATPKDGPSAGVAIAVSLISLLTGKPVRSDTAMTGEITLRGRVMPVGGIKEKVLAAHRAGIRTILLPDKNEKDLIDVPDEIRKEMIFKGIATIDEALALVFNSSSETQRTPPAGNKTGAARASATASSKAARKSSRRATSR